MLIAAPAAASAADYVPGQVIVGYAQQPTGTVTANIARATGTETTQAAPSPAPDTQVVKLKPGVTVTQALRKLRRQRGVAYAVPNFIAHASGSWTPNDPGRTKARAGWQRLQWNFLPSIGVNAPQAWANLIADHRPGGKGVTIAILDTGVAFRNWKQFRKSPDFGRTRFVSPYDFVSHNRNPLDREGHGTFVAGTVAESTNNGYGLTGLAYGASIMPVRILDADGTGDAATISRGIRYAATHGAQVINLSLEFSLDVTSSDIPDIISAIRFAHSRGVIVVAAAGNEGVEQVAYPARAPAVISVGATTKDRCLAGLLQRRRAPRSCRAGWRRRHDAAHRLELPLRPQPPGHLPDHVLRSVQPAAVRLSEWLVRDVDVLPARRRRSGARDRQRRHRPPPESRRGAQATRADGPDARRLQAESVLRLRTARCRRGDLQGRDRGAPTLTQRAQVVRTISTEHGA